MTVHSAPPLVSSNAVVSWRNRRQAWAVENRTGGKIPQYLPAAECRLRDIARTLHYAYGTQHLGNWMDPTDEFVYIILSRKTAERASVPAFQALKRAASWESILAIGQAGICRTISGCGLEGKKAAAIHGGLLAVARRFGCPDLSCARGLSDEALLDFLISLPEVGPKSALCVMLYSFGRPTFPVDAHVGRVLARLGCFSTLGVNLSPMGHKTRQRVLEDAVPPDLRYGLHVNLIAHGRSVCHARNPACNSCMLKVHCSHSSGIPDHKRSLSCISCSP